jgi:hypothetical protein
MDLGLLHPQVLRVNLGTRPMEQRELGVGRRGC